MRTQHQNVTTLLKGTLALVLAGGRGSRLKHLTNWRAKPAMPFGGKFRIIDFALSNCVNAGIRRIGVVTQYKAHSLIHHVQRAWGFMRAEFNEFVELLPAQQRTNDESWYRGTADAVYQNIDIIENHNPEYVLILAGDHIYKMDYGKMVEAHVNAGADLTIACIEVPVEEAKGFGVVDADANGRIVGFVEKPADPPTIPDQPDKSFCSMGVYVFNKKFLMEQLIYDSELPDSSHDFGKDLIPRMIKDFKVIAHRFGDSVVINEAREDEAYWRDVGTVDAYWEANIDLTTVTPALNLYDNAWPIWTYQEQQPPAKFVFDSEYRRGMAVDSTVSGGCVISGSRVQRSLLFTNVRVNSFSLLEDAVVLPGVDVGRYCRLHRVVIDRGCRIPQGLVVGEDAELDARRFYRTEKGIVLITKEMLEGIADEVDTPKKIARRHVDLLDD